MTDERDGAREMFARIVGQHRPDTADGIRANRGDTEMMEWIMDAMIQFAASRPTDAGAGNVAFCATDIVGMKLTTSLATPKPPVDEPWPGYTADQDRRRVETLAKLGLMLSVMADGEAPEVTGFDVADLYGEVLMALAIEDAEDEDIALQDALDDPEGHMLTGAPKPPVDEAMRSVIIDLMAEWPDTHMPSRDLCLRAAAVIGSNLTGDGAGA